MLISLVIEFSFLVQDTTRLSRRNDVCQKIMSGFYEELIKKLDERCVTLSVACVPALIDGPINLTPAIPHAMILNQLTLYR